MPSGPEDLKGLKDFKAHLTLAGEAISRASRPRKPNWVAGSGRPFWVSPPNLRWTVKAREVRNCQKGQGLPVRL